MTLRSFLALAWGGRCLLSDTTECEHEAPFSSYSDPLTLPTHPIPVREDPKGLRSPQLPGPAVGRGGPPHSEHHFQRVSSPAGAERLSEEVRSTGRRERGLLARWSGTGQGLGPDLGVAPIGVCGCRWACRGRGRDPLHLCVQGWGQGGMNSLRKR